MTQLTLGPLVLPLHEEEQRALDQFILRACVQDWPAVVLRDRTLGMVSAYAWAPDPTPTPTHP